MRSPFNISYIGDHKDHISEAVAVPRKGDEVVFPDLRQQFIVYTVMNVTWYPHRGDVEVLLKRKA